MRNFIENHQFYYVNDVADFSSIRGEIDSMAFEFISSSILRIKEQTTPSIEFMSNSLDEIESQLSKWYSSYLAKIDNLENTNQFLAMQNISSEENGFYSLVEIDFDTSSNISYSKAEKGFTLSSRDETFIGKR